MLKMLMKHLLVRLPEFVQDWIIESAMRSGRVLDTPVDFGALNDHRHVRELIARIVPGLEDLASIDDTRREFHVRGRLLHSPEFPTADGKASFAPVEMPVTVNDAAHPFMLTTIRSEGQEILSLVRWNDHRYQRTQN